MRKRLLLVLLLSITQASAQDYAWPTNASQWITSTFGESRPRRFHAGMDVKTWNRVGYEAVAVRDGYVMRMRVSPFGYGRALYLKLDNGEIALYAHLLKFSDRLQAVAEAEQERRGRYSIVKEFSAGAMPVKKGEVIAYTGQSGIGVPHLHFELRTAGDRPTNPLRMGFKLNDNSPPQIIALAVRPLTLGSTVNDDFRPQIFHPALRNGGAAVPRYKNMDGTRGPRPRLKDAEPGWRQYIDQPIAVSGKVGFSISAYDYAAGVDNRYSVYSLKFFVDDELQFQSTYDELDYDHNRFVELDRDFALNFHGYGEFYKLYKEPGNPLPFYTQLNSWGGAVLIKEKNPSAAASASGAGSMQNAGGLTWGMHTFRVEVSDYFGNVSTLEGRLLAGPAFRIEPVLLGSDEQTLSIKQIATPSPAPLRIHDPLLAGGGAGMAREIRDVEVHIRQKEAERGPGGELENHGTWRNNRLEIATRPAWKKIAAELQTILQPRADGGIIPLPESAAPQLTINTSGADLIRLVAIDADSLRSLPFFIPVSSKENGARPAQPLVLQIRREFYPQYLRLEIEASRPLVSAPLLNITSEASATRRQDDALQPPLLPAEPNLFVAQVPLASLRGNVTIEASAEDFSGQQAAARETFSLTSIPANGAGSLVSPDRRMELTFWSGSLFGSLHGWVEIDSMASPDPLRLSEVYRCMPQDIPLSEGANAVIAFADSLTGLQQLGIYTRDRNKWEFVDNRLQAAKRQVWARTFALGDFAIFRDSQPPELGRSEPRNGATVRADRPLISVEVRDTMSGFESEEAIVLRLDGKNVIAEYDPERDVIFYTPKQPLSSGHHEYSIRAVDRSGNVAEKSASFIVP
jgi:hypothetical protein